MKETGTQAIEREGKGKEGLFRKCSEGEDMGNDRKVRERESDFTKSFNKLKRSLIIWVMKRMVQR